jgi:hypothetical protein
VRHRVRGGRNTDERGTGRRRQGRRRERRWAEEAGALTGGEAEQEEALVSEEGAGWRMQWREVGRAAQGQSIGMEEAGA